MRLEAVILSLVLLTPTVAAWDQFHGAPSRNTMLVLNEGPLDVIANSTLAEGVNVQTFYASASVLTPDGPTLLARLDGECYLVTLVPDESLGVSQKHIGSCGFQRLIAYNAAADLVYACFIRTSGAPTLQAFDRTSGALKWSIVPAQAFGAVGNVPWICGGGAYDAQAQELVVPFYASDEAGSDHRVAALNAVTGEILWTRVVRSVGLVGGINAGPELALRPWGVTLTTTGIIVTGWVFPCASCTKGDEAFTAWFTRAGSQVGFERTNTGAIGDTSITPATRPFPLSSFPVAKGPIAAGIFAGEVVFYNPETPRPVARAPVESIEPATSSLFYPAGAWVGDRIIMGLPHSVAAFDANLQPVWSWGEGLDLEVSDIVVTAPRTVNVLLGKAGTPQTKLVRLDARTGNVLDEIPLPVSPKQVTGDSGWYASLVPDGRGGLLVIDTVGHLVLLGQADPSRTPMLSAWNAFPAPTRNFALQVDAPSQGNVSRFDIDWGDGTRETITEPGEAIHMYAEAGTVEVRVLALHEDGLTATSTFLVSVGGTEPVRLSAIQRAFAPERADLTFGVLGIILTLIGALYTVGRTRLRINRLERQLEVVEEMRLMATERPLEAVRAIRQYRDALPAELSRRRLDEAHYHVLEARAARLLRILRARLLAPFDARFSPGYRRILDATFEDGTLGQLEFDALVDALRREADLPEVDRIRVTNILAEFTPMGRSRQLQGGQSAPHDAGDVANNA